MWKREQLKEMDCRWDRFQFLIGNVETLGNYLVYLKEILFQFLIGNVETGNKIISRKRQYIFQFLIGNVETLSFNSSIPCSIYFNSS